LYTNAILIKNGISHPCFYGDVIEIEKYKSDTSKDIFVKVMSE